MKRFARTTERVALAKVQQQLMNGEELIDQVYGDDGSSAVVLSKKSNGLYVVRDHYKEGDDWTTGRSIDNIRSMKAAKLYYKAALSEF